MIDRIAGRFTDLMLRVQQVDVSQREIEQRFGLPSFRLRPLLREINRWQASGKRAARKLGVSRQEAARVERVLVQLQREPRRVAAELGLPLGALPRLFESFRQGERMAAAARKALVEANLRLVVSVAKRYAHHGMPLLDLIQEGNFGLIKAVERFDHRRGCKFSTYATWWIRQSITRGLSDRGRTIRIPVHRVESITRLNVVQRGLAHRLGREPATEEIAEGMGVPLAKVRQVLEVAKEPISLDKPVGEKGAPLESFIEAPESNPSSMEGDERHAHRKNRCASETRGAGRGRRPPQAAAPVGREAIASGARCPACRRGTSRTRAAARRRRCRSLDRPCRREIIPLPHAAYVP